MNKIREAITFERVVMAAIVANAAMMTMAWTIEGHEELFELLHQAFLVFFAAELGIRLRRMNWNPKRFLRDGWAMFDAVVIAVALLPTAGSVLILQTVRTARLAHLLRHVGHATAHVRMVRILAK